VYILCEQSLVGASIASAALCEFNACICSQCSKANEAHDYTLTIPALRSRKWIFILPQNVLKCSDHFVSFRFQTLPFVLKLDVQPYLDQKI